MKFEMWKYYRHSTGSVLFICGIANTHIYGNVLVGDDKSGSLMPISRDEAATMNYHEITKQEFEEI